MHTRFRAWLGSLFATEDGVTAIEYGLIAALIAVAIIAGISAVGSDVQLTFNTWTGAVRDAIDGANGS